MNKEIKAYLRKIGRRGGKKSRRTITPEQQAKMQAGRKRGSFPKTGIDIERIK